jgi:hypothetical protein
MKFKLNDDRQPIPCSDEDFAAWHSTLPEDMRTEKGSILLLDKIGNLLVSTVFLGEDVSVPGDNPKYWESMVFGLGMQPTYRYSSERAAIEGHGELLSMIVAGEFKPQQPKCGCQHSCN